MNSKPGGTGAAAGWGLGWGGGRAPAPAPLPVAGACPTCVEPNHEPHRLRFEHPVARDDDVRAAALEVEAHTDVMQPGLHHMAVLRAACRAADAAALTAGRRRQWQPGTRGRSAAEMAGHTPSCPCHGQCPGLENQKRCCTAGQAAGQRADANPTAPPPRAPACTDTASMALSVASAMSQRSTNRPCTWLNCGQPGGRAGRGAPSAAPQPRQARSQDALQMLPWWPGAGRRCCHATQGRKPPLRRGLGSGSAPWLPRGQGPPAGARCARRESRGCAAAGRCTGGRGRGGRRPRCPGAGWRSAAGTDSWEGGQGKGRAG